MAILLAATGPAVVLLAQRLTFLSDRQQVSLTATVEINPYPWSGVVHSYDRTELEGFKARNRGDASRLTGRFQWPEHPPIM